jgi:hypothetical protein
VAKNKGKQPIAVATGAESADRLAVERNSGEIARLLHGVESEQSLSERVNKTGELIQAILQGQVRSSFEGSAGGGSREMLTLTAGIARSSLVGVGSGVPAAFTIAQLQALFGAQGGSTQQIARYTAALSMFRGLLGPVDSMSSAQEAIKPAIASELEAVYAPRSAYQEQRGRAAARRDLRQHRAYDTQARSLSETISVWDKLVAIAFNPRQFQRVLTCLAYLREGFALQRGNDGLIDPDQKGNWLHTMDEMDAVLDRTVGRSHAEIERALMGMFGDAWKTKFNFTRHNYDGAEVARIVLSRQLDSDFTASDVQGIVEANREHQVSPPAFMGALYVNKISGTLNAQRGALWGELIEKSKTNEMTADEQNQLAYWTEVAMEQDYRHFQLALLKQHPSPSASTTEAQAGKSLEERARFGSFITDEDFKALVSIQRKIANPYAQELEDTAAGGKAVKLSDLEREFLRLSGIDHWHIPHERTPWFWISRTGVVADILANLGVGGRCKLTRLNGPETDPAFQFATISACVSSGLKTYADIDKLLNAEEHDYILARLNTVNGAVDRAMSRLEAWLRDDLGLEENESLQDIPFWDAPLKYPHRGADEAHWWNANRIPEAQRTKAQQQLWSERRFDGLTDKERIDYLRAIRIRDRAVEELGRELRLDDKLVPDFKPVMCSRRKACHGN